MMQHQSSKILIVFCWCTIRTYIKGLINELGLGSTLVVLMPNRFWPLGVSISEKKILGRGTLKGSIRQLGLHILSLNSSNITGTPCDCYLLCKACMVDLRRLVYWQYNVTITAKSLKNIPDQSFHTTHNLLLCAASFVENEKFIFKTPKYKGL